MTRVPPYPGGTLLLLAGRRSPRRERRTRCFGHPAPLLVRADGTIAWPEPSSYALPLGLAAHGTEPPEPFRADFRPGDQLLLYTDGITEARDAEGRFYPLAERAHRRCHVG